MTRSARIVSACVLGLSAACGGADLTLPPGPGLPMVRLRSEPYSFTFYSGMDAPARMVVRDAVTWQAVWNQIHLRQSPVPPLPPIDFARDMIVVVALGSRSTGGYGIRLDGAAEAANNGIAVIVESSSPGSDCGVTEAFTQPVDIARVPLRGGPVSFIERSHVSHCG